MSIRRNTLWNVVGSAAPMAVGLWAVPILLARLGTEAFGVVSLIWALVGYFSVFDFGVSRALTQQISAHRGAAAAEVADIAAHGFLLVMGFGVIGGMALASAAHQLGHYWLNVNEALRVSTTNCLYLAAISIPVVTLTAGQRGVLEGLEEFGVANALRIFMGVANFVLPVASVICFGASLEWVVASLVFGRVLAAIGYWKVLRKRLGPYSSARGPVKWVGTRALLSFGAWMTVSNMVSPLMVTADRFVVSYLLGAAAVAYYTVPFDFIVRLLVLPAALTSTLFPRFALLFRSDMPKLRQLYRRAVLGTSTGMLFLCLILASTARPGLRLWLGESFADLAWPVAAVLSVGLLFNGIAQLPHAAIQASGDSRTTALLHLGEFILYVPLLLGSLAAFGTVGAAAAWTTRVLLDLLALLVLAQRKLT